MGRKQLFVSVSLAIDGVLKDYGMLFLTGI